MDDTKNLVAKVAETNHSEKCNLYIAKEKFFYSGYGFPFPHGSPYVDVFNDGYVMGLWVLHDS